MIAHHSRHSRGDVIVTLRGHGRVLVIPAIIAVLLAGAGALWLPVLPEPFSLIASVLALVGTLVLCVRPYLRWATTVTTISATDIVVRSGIIRRRYHEVALNRIYDIAVHQTLGQSLAGSGDIELNTGLDRPFVIRDVATVARVRAAITELVAARTDTLRP